MALAALFVQLRTVAGQSTDSATPSVRCELDRRTCYEGDSVVYRVTVSNVEDTAEPDLSQFEDFEVRSLGRRSQSSQFVGRVNGRRTVVRRISTVFSYSLTPQRNGELQVPAPVVTIDGSEYAGNELALKVVPPAPQNSVLCEIRIEPREVYPSEPFDVSLVIDVEALPESLGDRDPVTILSEYANAQPALDVPWVNDNELPLGLAAERSWRDWIAQYQTGDIGGFTINGLSTRSTFGLRPILAAFRPDPRRVTGRGADGQQRDYWEYRFTRRFVADRVGTFEFGPVRIKGQFVSHASGGRPVLEPIYAVARTATVEVQDVPAAGRPDSYIGAIGRFAFELDVNPRKARAGDPLTLVITVRGEGNVDSIVAPDLLQIPEIPRQFKLYEATTATEENARTFTMSIRPKSGDVNAFPPVPMAYFDVEKDAYVELTSEAIPLDIAPATQFDDSALASIEKSGRRESAPLEVAADGIYMNITELSEFQDDRVRPIYWWVAWAGLLSAYGLACYQVVQHRRRSPRRQRQQAARRLARQRLSEARAAWDRDESLEAAELLASAVRGLVADYADRDGTTLTTREVLEILQTRDVPPELCEQARSVLAACDEVRFSGARSGARLQSQTEQLIDDLARVWRLK